ncbi:DUF1804 family protein [Qipengyuania flava]|nr:DUF1804 family protein [Qipengyuania flava]
MMSRPEEIGAGAAAAWPAWIEPFLAALRAGHGVRRAAGMAGVALSTAYDWRRRDAEFAFDWDDARGRPVVGAACWGGARRTGPRKVALFLEALAESSNVRAAAAAAGLAVRTVYHLRRTDADFARQWYAALAEGYDNLEMELLAHLRSGGEVPGGESGGETGGESQSAPARKFDTAAALRSLAAHRESVAREKGRRALADEAATIASINRKIDQLRLRGQANEEAIRASRKRAAKRARG